ncbi:response regulator transcription factor [Cryptosporangium phraense]|uniref:Response regulator transcription factor n=1 Tax=Cryptosporangium phraense TaxID=2593070 RepID=A0A545AS46_9ACTN|nr:LuxR C-terminal-related transcriptional regulator [Cryptosporangium phraense]TQS44071.1 response regulator transcription factor [Cryptosporangium phraense]
MYRSATDLALDFSWRLAGASTPVDLESSASEWLSRTLGVDYAGFTDLRRASMWTVRLRLHPRDRMTSAAETAVNALLREEGIAGYPLFTHYLRQPADRAPRRTSDLVSDRNWTRTRTYEVLKPVGGRRVLALLVGTRAGGLDAFMASRSGRDFSDDAMDVARAVQPVLVAAHHLVRGPRISAVAAERARLTPAESQIVALLTAGLTAEAIARVRRVSPRTVHKQLEHLYAKLGLHDRLQVAAYARRTGLVEEPAPP